MAKKNGYTVISRPCFILRYLLTIAKHEIGHILGLEHPEKLNAPLSNVMKDGYVYDNGQHFEAFANVISYYPCQISVIRKRIEELAIK